MVTHTAIQPGSRRWDLLVLVAREGPITLTEIAGAAGLARTSVRQQLDRLIAGGWVDRTQRRGKPGRPVDVFSLSDEGRRLFARQIDDFAGSMMQVLADTDGKAKLRSVIKGVGSRMTDKLRPKVGDGPQGDRVRRVAELLNEGGALNDVSESERGLKLTIHTCPYHGLPEGRGEFCEMEREMMSSLVGAETSLNRCMSDGSARCELEVKLRPNGASTS
jgi:predicted ArsR family transcriptional regulator